MALFAGTRLGPYEIVAPLGAGGMGEVYRARDTKLNRDVALKVLPDQFAADPDRLARFKREAHVLASLNHPNIAAIYGLEESDGVRALVLELVEGQTLADRIAQGPMPLDEALPIARQIAEALEAAHEHGVVHRDLKPANIKLTADGSVKVLDFGLAKALGDDAMAGDLSSSPTMSAAAVTRAGIILGTAAYMSPEQARGKVVDKRTDIWAFGCVLYEMLTGKRAFKGEAVSDTLAAVLRDEPDWSALPANLPASVCKLVERCLEKERKRRIADISVPLFFLNEPVVAPALTPPFAPRYPLWKHATPAVAAALVAGVLVGAAGWRFKPLAPLPVTRFPFTLGEGQQFNNTTRTVVAISPDGTQMVYVSGARLYLRSMSELEGRPIPGIAITQGVFNPVFSPDGRSIAFWSSVDRTLKKIAISGGAAVTICPADNPFGMSWGADGIVFGQGSKGIMRVSAHGGKPELLVSVKGGEQAHGPLMLPGGEAVLFTLATGTGADRWDKAQIVVQSLRSGERKTLLEGGSDARYLPTGHIVYAFGGTLFAVPFDLKRLDVTSGPVPIIEGVRRALGPSTGAAHFAFSNAGSLIYIPGPVSTSSAQFDLALVDRKGGVEPLKLPSGAYRHPRISPDGKQVAFEASGTDDSKDANVWIDDLSGATSMRRLTFGARNRFPLWSADGQRVAFQSDREGDLGIFWQRADGTGTAERLTKPEEGTSHVPESWSPKGERFLFGVTKGSGVSLWTFSLPDRKATPFDTVQSSQPINSAFSPDGRWVAYFSDEGGNAGIFVQPFPGTGARYQIASRPGCALWSSDGKELFYTPQGQLLVVSVTTQPSFTFSNPMQVPRGFTVPSPTSPRSYDITPDGRFIGIVPSGQTETGTSNAQQIQVVLNWFEELKARVPIK